MFDWKTQQGQWRERADKSLEHYLPAAHIAPERFNGGKRVRPILVYAAGHALDVNPSHLDSPAVAIELIHAYSLVHDDLPAMDDDDLRRGQPTCHKAFDEASAILVGDALQSLAFQVLSEGLDAELPAAQLRDMIKTLALCSGSRGMAGGQAIDLASVGIQLDIAQLENMHVHKTGALIRASVRMGALCKVGIDDASLGKLDHYAKCIGLAFQIQDDILDVEGDTETLGKTQGADIARNKPTYPALMGLSESKQMAAELVEDAVNTLAPFGEAAEPLRAIANYIINRAY